jgi:hypothetical protein
MLDTKTTVSALMMYGSTGLDVTESAILRKEATENCPGTQAS